MTKGEAFIEKLEAFAKAARDLTEAWEVNDAQEFNVDMGYNYPFTISFDELSSNIDLWCDTLSALIKGEELPTKDLLCVKCKRFLAENEWDKTCEICYKN